MQKLKEWDREKGTTEKLKCIKHHKNTKEKDRQSNVEMCIVRMIESFEKIHSEYLIIINVSSKE